MVVVVSVLVWPWRLEDEREGGAQHKGNNIISTSLFSLLRYSHREGCQCNFLNISSICIKR